MEQGHPTESVMPCYLILEVNLQSSPISKFNSASTYLPQLHIPSSPAFLLLFSTTSMMISTWRSLMLLACVLLIAEFTSFSEGRLIVAGEDDRPAASSVEEQMYKMARAQEHLGSGSPPGRMYQASARPVPRGSNPLHNR